MSDEAITFLIVGATVAVFVWDRFPVAVVAIAVALSLWATGILTLEESLAGFGDPIVIFIAGLLVVAEALDATGVTGWVGHQLIDRSGASRNRARPSLIRLSLVMKGSPVRVRASAFGYLQGFL
jgi:di/tricarboxylate transporter